ncbi:hypothetical protein BBBOND_0203240 [Babesia bigemina]|uniref:Uncharacterized protein n=1 Tax=Babesia bigemina TaxID=5866 RepID=A0A061D543_BABBI|nr:hypothetical protein BBBOND_0203240 [Babesia bigemina]CDR95167.1 hypothetical protein BBBOND_0203240 [Babesia bigemina]|eukprot:XP_012767353.1 hypothetical protein BBBOND_0203240 [Babesia bigemina]
MLSRLDCKVSWCVAAITVTGGLRGRRGGVVSPNYSIHNTDLSTPSRMLKIGVSGQECHQIELLCLFNLVFSACPPFQASPTAERMCQ